MAEKGATEGRVRGTSVPGTRVFYRPSLGKIVFRPTNVIRSSDRVIDINDELRDLADSPNHPAKICKGRGWKEFIKCMKKEMKKAVKPVGGPTRRKTARAEE